MAPTVSRGKCEAPAAFEISTSEEFSTITTTTPTAVDASTDYTLSTDVGSLDAATRYWYRAVLTDLLDRPRRNPSSIGTFRTAPALGTSADIVFAFSADVHQDHPERLGILDAIAAKNPAFFLNLGDFPRCDDGTPATDRSGYRAKHALVRSFDEIETFFLSVPACSLWDDHEIVDDWDGNTDPDLVGHGIETWKEWFPHRPTAGSSGGIYRSFRWGAALEVFLLDTRFFRSPNDALDDASKTMLGATQKQWLKDCLLASTAIHKVVVTSVPLRYGTTGNDHWEGFATERGEILDFITGNGIDGVFFLAGDQHWAAVHRHPEGILEVMACPLSAQTRVPPSSPDPHVVFQSQAHNYGLVRIDGQTGGCVIELRDAGDDLLHTEVVR